MMAGAWEQWGAWLVAGAQGVLAWALWSLTRVFARADAVREAMGRLREAQQEQAACLTRAEAQWETRLSALEGRLRATPDAAALGSLASGVECLRGDIKALEERISGMDRLLVRLERLCERHWTRGAPGGRQVA